MKDKKIMIEENFITPEDVIKEKSMVLGYSPYIDQMSGALEWFKKDQEEIIYATPSWNDDFGITPFDNENGEHFLTLDLTAKKYHGNFKMQLDKYFDNLRDVLKLNDKVVELNKLN